MFFIWLLLQKKLLIDNWFTLIGNVIFNFINVSFSNCPKNKRTYEQKCREADGADDALKKSVSLVSKDEEKVCFNLSFSVEFK